MSRGRRRIDRRARSSEAGSRLHSVGDRSASTCPRAARRSNASSDARGLRIRCIHTCRLSTRVDRCDHARSPSRVAAAWPRPQRARALCGGGCRILTRGGDRLGGRRALANVGVTGRAGAARSMAIGARGDRAATRADQVQPACRVAALDCFTAIGDRLIVHGQRLVRPAAAFVRLQLRGFWAAR